MSNRGFGALWGLCAFGLMFASACSEEARFEGRSPPVVSFMAKNESRAVGTRKKDAADDAAVWVHPTEPKKSLVLGTDKKRGLHFFDMRGRNHSFHEWGRLNNVDLRQGISLTGTSRDIGTASLRGTQYVLMFELDPANGSVLGHETFETGHTDPYGLCMGEREGTALVFVTYKDGLIQAYKVLSALPHPVIELIDETKVSSQIEGCVFDDARGRLFVGEENVGIHSFVLGADGKFEPGVWVDRIRRDGPMASDVEGLALAETKTGPWLIASNQSRDNYLVYSAVPPFTGRAVFEIIENETRNIDGVSHTDGIAVSTEPLGRRYPCGVFIAQDDDNRPLAQNFKYVDWCLIEKGLTVSGN